MAILIFILILLVSVLIHELGHFIVAKKVGVKVEEFAFGFPPRLFSIKRGETDYSFNALPIGGYVKMFGEDDAGGGRAKASNVEVAESDRKRAFYAQKPSKRFAIGIAGVTMNFLLSIVLSYIFLAFTHFTTIIPCVGNPAVIGGTAHKFCSTKIVKVVPGSPAEEAGIKSDSQVLKVNGEDLSTATKTFPDIVTENKGKPITILLQDKNKKDYQVTVTPRVNPPKGQGALGVVFSGGSYIIISYDSLVQKIFSGISYPLNLVTFQIGAAGELISVSVANLFNSLSGIVCVGSAVNHAISTSSGAGEATLNVFNLAILLSVALGFMNLLPIPALDGGRLAFIVIEWVTGKKNPNLEAKINAISMYFLLTLMAWIIIHDIIRLASGQC